MTTHEESIEFLATYALDAVEGDERDAIEEHLAECPRCRTELDAFREVTTALGNSVEPLPEGLWTSIASHLPAREDEERPPMPRLVVSEDGEGGDELAPAERRPWTAPGRGRFATLAAVVVAAAAVVTVLSVSLVHANDQVSQLQRSADVAAPGAVVSALETPGHKVVNLEGPAHHRLAQFVVVPGGRGYLVSSRLPALSSNRTYQLWGVISGRPISLGLLGPLPDQATFTMASSDAASKLSITVEPADGSIVPSGAVVAQGVV